jgi:Competence protein
MGYHPESLEHFAGKLALAEYLKAELSEQSDVEVIIEYPIPEAGEHGRIADVAAVFPSGWVLVYECQLAAITPELLEQRTKDYASVGADVLWFLGGKANSIPNITWCEEYFGNCLFIKLEKDSQSIDLWSSESS